MPRNLILRYTLFALIAAAANIGAQDLFIRSFKGTFDIVISVILGTSIGLVVKYILNKRYIFSFKARSVAHYTQTFALYTFMGLTTTLIFWGFEFSFHYVFETKEMRYLGGVIGLAIGFPIKYHLDRRYVFPAEAV
jgi:putative flippase GtrA